MVALKNMGHLVFLPLLILSILIYTSSAKFTSKVGINYGQLGNNLPSPSKSVELIKSLKAKLVKIYDTNPKILNSLKHTNIKVSVMLPNELISNISSNQTLSDLWVRSNVQPFYPHTKIRYLLVGNEIISSTDNKTWYNLVPAMRKIKSSLKAHGIHKVKVGTSCAMDVLESSYPPSNETFRADISGRVMKPMLQFLNKTRSFFFLDAYPYFSWSSDPTNIKLDYALFESKNYTYTDPGSGLVYTNLFDQMVDAVIFAMRRLGYPGIRVWIAETGWPNGGDFDQIGCNIYNAATYNRNAVKKLTSESGTPARPGQVLPSFIFSLYNENQKPGPGTERHFGLLYPNGSKIYEIDLSGETQVWAYKKPLPKPTNDEKYKGKTPMSYSDPQPAPQPLPIRCTNIAPSPPLAPNPYYPWPPPVPDLETLDPPPLPPFQPYPPPLHDPYYPLPFLPPPPSSNSEEAWYTRATPLVLFLTLLVALISGLTTLVCKCFCGRWISNPSNSITAATSPPISFNYEF